MKKLSWLSFSLFVTSEIPQEGKVEVFEINLEENRKSNNGDEVS